MHVLFYFLWQAMASIAEHYDIIKLPDGYNIITDCLN